MRAVRYRRTLRLLLALSSPDAALLVAEATAEAVEDMEEDVKDVDTIGREWRLLVRKSCVEGRGKEGRRCAHAPPLPTPACPGPGSCGAAYAAHIACSTCCSMLVTSPIIQTK
jgi:hypothetical protein